MLLPELKFGMTATGNPGLLTFAAYLTKTPMSLQELLQLRMQLQQITNHSFQKPEALVTWTGAVQAQDYAMCQWALGLRLPGTTEKHIEEAFNNGRVLRTHVLRPTWHLVAPADIRWMLQLTAPRIQAYSASYYRQSELDTTTFSKSNKVLEKVLRDNNHLSRTQLAAALNKAKINTEDLRLTHLLAYAELEGLICSGARQGKQVTYALLEERVPPTPRLSKEESLAELARRYFQSHGPATINDFTWWSGLNKTEAKQGQQLISNELTFITLGKDELAFIDKGIAPIKNNDVFLLPNYDEFTVAYSDREVLMGKDATTMGRNGNPLFSNIILVNGKVEGTWKRTIKPQSVTVTTELFSTLPATKQKQLQQRIGQYEQFLQQQ